MIQRRALHQRHAREGPSAAESLARARDEQNRATRYLRRVCVCVCVCVCVFISYVYICICVYIYIYIYICNVHIYL